jgi:hypothetical protein
MARSTLDAQDGDIFARFEHEFGTRVRSVVWNAGRWGVAIALVTMGVTLLLQHALESVMPAGAAWKVPGAVGAIGGTCAFIAALRIGIALICARVIALTQAVDVASGAIGGALETLRHLLRAIATLKPQARGLINEAHSMLTVRTIHLEAAMTAGFDRALRQATIGSGLAGALVFALIALVLMLNGSLATANTPRALDDLLLTVAGAAVVAAGVYTAILLIRLAFLRGQLRAVEAFLRAETAGLRAIPDGLTRLGRALLPGHFTDAAPTPPQLPEP